MCGASCVWISSSRSRRRPVVLGVLACVHMYILYVCVYLCVCEYVCGQVYMYVDACVYVYVYVCIYIHVYMYVYTYLFIDCESQYQYFSVWTVSCMCMRIRVHMYAYAYVCKYIYMCIFFAVSAACTLEQVFWALVHGQVCTLHRCFFHTNVHICEHTRCRLCTYVYMHIYVYMHAYVYGCVCASMILLDTHRDPLPCAALVFKNRLLG